MKIKRGSSVDLKFLIQDQNGVIITDLATATSIAFMVKLNKADGDSSALISKSLTNGITVNSPSTGYIKVSLSAADTLITSGNYFFGLKIKYSTTKKYEVDVVEDITTLANPIDVLAINEDVVHDV